MFKAEAGTTYYYVDPPTGEILEWVAEDEELPVGVFFKDKNKITKELVEATVLEYNSVVGTLSNMISGLSDTVKKVVENSYNSVDKATERVINEAKFYENDKRD